MSRRITLNIRVELDSQHDHFAFAPLIHEALSEWIARRDVKVGQLTPGLQLTHSSDFDATQVRLYATVESAK